MTNQYVLCRMASAHETDLSAGPGGSLALSEQCPRRYNRLSSAVQLQSDPPQTYSIRRPGPQVKANGKRRFRSDDPPISAIGRVSNASGTRCLMLVVAHQLHLIKTTTTPLTIPSALLLIGGLFFCLFFPPLKTVVRIFIHEPNFKHRTNFSHFRPVK